MARPAHFYEPGFPYLITSVTDHRQPLLTQNGNGRRVLNDLDFYRNQFRYQLLGYVIMPDHFHTVILPSEDDFKRFALNFWNRNAPARFITATTPSARSGIT